MNFMILSIPIKLLLSLLLGSVIGLEREAYDREIDIKTNNHNGHGSLGIRSFALITLSGTIAGLLEIKYFSLFLIISITFMTLLISYYVIGSILTKDNGITTELAIMISFIIGIIIALDIFPIQLTIAIVIVLVMILSIKERLQLIVAGIKQHELHAFISYAIIALVILPFLPNISYSLSNLPGIYDILSSLNINLGKIAGIEIINPFNLWRVVAIITGVEVIGYLLQKTIGQKKGLLLTSIAGGFISSTSTTQSLANQSHKSKNINRLTGAAVFANMSSFVQHFLLIATVNSIFLAKNTPYLLTISFTSLIIGVYLFKKKGSSSGENLTKNTDQMQAEIFSLKPALQFAIIFILVKIFSNIALVLFGETAFLATIIIAAFTGLDAVTINLSQLVGNTISYQMGILAFILANAVNLLSKAGYSFIQGKREFALKFTLSVLLIIITGLFTLIPIFR